MGCVRVRMHINIPRVGFFIQMGEMDQVRKAGARNFKLDVMDVIFINIILQFSFDDRLDNGQRFPTEWTSSVWTDGDGNVVVQSAV